MTENDTDKKYYAQYPEAKTRMNKNRKQGSFYAQFEGRALARRSDPSTSHEAARSVTVGTLQRVVLRELRKYQPDGLTMNQVVETTALPNESITPRFKPLNKLGLIYNTGKLRMNSSGRRAIVWDITSLGLSVLEIRPVDGRINK